MNPSRPRVLIVDDDASFGGMVAEILAEKGYDAVRFTDPGEALARGGGAGFAAAVVDLMMPAMSGLELTERLKAGNADIEVLILTGHGDMDSAIEGIHQGVFDYLQKGTLQLGRLERAVRAAVEKHRLTLENRDLLEKLRESNSLLKALHEVSTSLAGEPHLDRLLARLVASAKELCRAEAGRALIFDMQGEEKVIAVAAGDGGEALRGARLQPGEGVATLALEEDRTVVVDDVRQHPRYSHRCDEIPARAPGFLAAPVRHGSVWGVLTVAGRRDRLFSAEDGELLLSLARHAAVAIENAFHHERAVNFFTHTSELLVSVLESMDVYYPGHSRGVAALADMVTRRLGLSEAERRNVHFAALLHDIGKIRLDPAILKSAGFASEEGRRLMREHPALGLQILKPIIMWEEILPIIHAHHERWDGKGYPRGLKGEEIPLGGRVVAVADAFDAMTRDTPHGPQRTPDEALAEIEAFSGTQFDPLVARLFVAEYRQHGDSIRR